MKSKSMKMVPGAASLILIIVVLCMVVLEMLTLMSAISDSRLSERAVQVAEANFVLKNRSEQSLQTLTETLAGCDTPEAVEAALADTEFEYDAESNTVYWMECEDIRVLECEVRLDEGAPKWTMHTLWTDMEGDSF